MRIVIATDAQIGKVYTDEGDIIICRDSGQVHVSTGGCSFLTIGVSPSNYWGLLPDGPIKTESSESDDEKAFAKLNSIQATVNQIAVMMQMTPEEQQEFAKAAKTVDKVRAKTADPFGWVQ